MHRVPLACCSSSVSNLASDGQNGAVATLMTLKRFEEHASVMCCSETARPCPPGRRLYHASNKLTETRGTWLAVVDNDKGVVSAGATSRTNDIKARRDAMDKRPPRKVYQR